jgi:glycosyltransferase involved in cell wall biosynthesis
MSYSQPLISVLINNYNYGRFLREAIDSVLNQTYTNIEVIVVDDGSADDSRAVIASYGSRIWPIFKENGGQASAFNAGFAASKGDLICLLDSDDVWLPTKVEMAVAKANQCKDAVMIYHAYQRTDAQLRPIGKSLPRSFLEGEVGEKVLRSGGCWPYPPPSAFAFRRAVLACYMPIPEVPFRTCADACLAYCTPLLGRIAAIKQSLCLYRIHGSNLYTRLTTGKEDRARIDLARMDRYRLNVEGANQVLADLGRTERFWLRDHTSYNRAMYGCRIMGRPSWVTMSWKLACMSSEPSWCVRLKMVVKFWLESLGWNFGRRTLVRESQ